jgi:hypothetical protein
MLTTIRCVLLATLLTGISTVAEAQDERSAVLGTVQRFFDAMATRDTALAGDVLILDATYFSVREQDGVPVIRGSTNRAFVEGLAGGTDVLQERMWDAEVSIRGAIAVVWTPYDFHVNGEFSHCGVDAFSLIETADGWKIAGIVYTVERDCVTTDSDDR